MSLKAKIEAVIYASEEPVTQVQLMGLLGEEAQLELDAREAEQPSLALEQEEESAEEAEAGDADALNAEATAMADAAEDAASMPTAEPEETAEAGIEPTEDDKAVLSGSPAGAVEAASSEPSAKVLAAEAKVRERKLRAYFREILDELIKDYATGDRGLEVREVAGGFRLATKPEYHDAVRGFVKQLKPPLKLSLQALETLAVVAYKQPVTAPEVAEIRGVDSGGVLGSLITRKLIQTAGRKQVIGRPMLYKTSKEFLVRFGLKDINELPSIEEFEKMAGELMEPVQEEMQMDQDRESFEAAERSKSLDELHAASEQGDAVHESPEEMLSDKRPHPAGAAEEPEPADAERAADQERSAEVEPMADVHEDQADGEV
jgi:segregation and condensation protein B